MQHSDLQPGAWPRRLLPGLAGTCALANLAAWYFAVGNGPALLALNLLCAAALAWHALRPAAPQALAAQLLAVREHERQRLGRDLHDELGQLLGFCRLRLEWLGKRLGTELQAPAQEINAALAEALEKMRDISSLLNPRQLASLGLEASLRSHLLRALAGTSLQWSLQCRQGLNGLDEAMAVAVFRIVQEAASNTLRHAQARHLSVQLERQAQGLALALSDDGRGFDGAAALAQGRGLAGIRERAQALGGHLRVASAPGQGCRLSVLLPWPKPRAARAGREAP
ncbi:histidine kinase [Pseudomonas sp. NPDC007930]|uniref:sensor histidine kinase n=1 Tax=Pseudomonas sp. NPDC007930 TaxID=3364417 RepID=UPI0036E99B8D